MKYLVTLLFISVFVTGCSKSNDSEQIVEEIEDVVVGETEEGIDDVEEEIEDVEEEIEDVEEEIEDVEEEIEDVEEEIKPFSITSITQNVFFDGAKVQVSGSQLDDAISVTLNNIPLDITSQNSHELYFTVPAMPAGDYELEFSHQQTNQLHTQTLEYANKQLVNTISVGEKHNCAIKSDKTVVCWGSNVSGELGNDNKRDGASAIPVSVVGLTEIMALGLGQDHSCALKDDGTVSCWGRNSFGMLGDNSTTERESPVTVSNLSTVIALTTGNYHNCVLKADRTVACWGRNYSGQLGDGTTVDALVPVVVQGLTNVSAISAGYNHTCALKDDNTMVCWGSNTYGQLGDGTTTDALAFVSSAVSSVKTIELGGDSSCIIKLDDTVDCWGDNSDGKLGNGSLDSSVIPVAVTNVTNTAALTNVATLSMGDNHSCATTYDGDGYCWGNNEDGQLGDDSELYMTTPILVTQSADFNSIHVGSDHTCGLKEDNSIACWGDNGENQLGYDDTISYVSSPVSMPSLVNITSHDLGDNHSCAIKDDDSVVCWGRNQYGQLGNGDTVNSTYEVKVVSGLDDVASLGLGASHSCALQNTGSVLCWGYNLYGQLGDSSENDSSTPVQVLNLNNPVSVEVGSNHNCALKDNGTVVCWGSNQYGQLGNGTEINSSTPVAVSNLTDAVDIKLGDEHSCAIKSDASVVCWGRNGNGALGTGDLSNYSVPVAVVGLTDVMAIDAGDLHTCAVKIDGSVQCWGYAYSGQLGDGIDNTLSTTPVSVVNLSDAVEVSLGYRYSCALKADGTGQCWGENSNGQLGAGTLTDSLIPVDIKGLIDTKQISLGRQHICSLYEDGALACWGRSSVGRIPHHFSYPFVLERD